MWEMDAYVTFHLKKRIWDSFLDKEAALASAQRLIAILPYKEPLTEPWPERIKQACFEIAIAYADGVDMNKEYRLLSKTTHGYGPLRQQRDTSMVEWYIPMGIPSFEAAQLLAPYLDLSTDVALERVS